MLPITISIAALAVAFFNLVLSRKWPSQQLHAASVADWRKAAQLCGDIADAARILMVIASLIWVIAAALLAAFNIVAKDAVALANQPLVVPPASTQVSPSSPFAPIAPATNDDLRQKLKEEIPLFQGVSAFVNTSIHIAFLASVLSMITVEWAIARWTTRYP